MESSLLQRLLSFENAFNKRRGATFPLYKFYRLYEDRSRMADEERQSQLFVENDKRTGFHVLNPFFISVLRDHSIWFAPSTQFNDPWDAGGAVSILRTSAAIKEPILKQLLSEEECAKVSLLPEEEKYKRIEDKLREAFSILRFACFTKHYDSNPMWAHYADNRSGLLGVSIHAATTGREWRCSLRSGVCDGSGVRGSLPGSIQQRLRPSCRNQRHRVRYSDPPHETSGLGLRAGGSVHQAG